MKVIELKFGTVFLVSSYHIATKSKGLFLLWFFFFLSEYKKSHTYTYEYVASVNSGFPETEERYAGLKITCDTDFYFETDTLAYLKVGVPVVSPAVMQYLMLCCTRWF